MSDPQTAAASSYPQLRSVVNTPELESVVMEGQELRIPIETIPDIATQVLSFSEANCSSQASNLQNEAVVTPDAPQLGVGLKKRRSVIAFYLVTSYTTLRFSGRPPKRKHTLTEKRWTDERGSHSETRQDDDIPDVSQSDATRKKRR